MSQASFFQSRWTKPLLHIVLWMAFLMYPFFVHHTQTYDTDTILRYSLYTLMMAGVFYLNAHLLIPSFIGQRKFVRYFLIILIIIAGVVGGNLLLQWFFNWEFYTSHDWMPEKVISSAVIMSILILGVSSGVRMAEEWLKNERLRQDIQNEKLASELALLKSQLNPHFLFNSLNSLYSLSKKDSDKTSEALLQLSNLLRYVLYETKGERVELQKELEHLQNYIEFQRLRLRKEVEVTYNQTGAPGSYKIAPMLLIPFVENAFKHGISNRHSSFVRVEVEISSQDLHFHVQNTDHHQEERAGEEGMGLDNVKRRLELLYPDMHELLIRQEEGEFRVNLKVPLYDA